MDVRIDIARSAGFCSGVKRAIEISLKTAKNRKDIYILGDIVHNETVIARMRKAGVRKISRLTRGKGKTLLIRAHGAGNKTVERAKRLGFKIVDATCPMVKGIHTIARRMEDEGYHLIVIGDENHAEVRGITGQLKNRATLIDPEKTRGIGRKFKNISKAAAVVQSTQDIDRVEKIRRLIERHVGEFKFFNTICGPTRIKQGEIKKLPLKYDVVIIVGSHKSANTKRLHAISKSLNRKSYRIYSEKEIRDDWFKGAESVAITAGASTPDEITKAVKNHITQLLRNRKHR